MINTETTIGRFRTCKDGDMAHRHAPQEETSGYDSDTKYPCVKGDEDGHYNANHDDYFALG